MILESIKALIKAISVSGMNVVEGFDFSVKFIDQVSGQRTHWVSCLVLVELFL